MIATTRPVLRLKSPRPAPAPMRTAAPAPDPEAPAPGPIGPRYWFRQAERSLVLLRENVELPAAQAKQIAALLTYIAKHCPPKASAAPKGGL